LAITATSFDSRILGRGRPPRAVASRPAATGDWSGRLRGRLLRRVRGVRRGRRGGLELLAQPVPFDALAAVDRLDVGQGLLALGVAQGP